MGVVVRHWHQWHSTSPEIPAELTIAVGKVGFQVRRWLQSVDFGLVRSGVSTLNRPESVASVRDLRTLGVGLTSPILDELRPARFVWTKLARFVPVWFFSKCTTIMFRVVLLTVIGLIGIGCQTINSDADDGNDQDDSGINYLLIFFLVWKTKQGARIFMISRKLQNKIFILKFSYSIAKVFY